MDVAELATLLWLVVGAATAYEMIWPVTIAADRYGGTYAGGLWLALPLHPAAVPDGPFGGDAVASRWWAELGDMPLERGDTPDRAYDDLARWLEAIRPTQTFEPRSDFSGQM